MRLDVADEALAVGRALTQIIKTAGGDLIVREVAADPDSRHDRIAPLFDRVGGWDLDARTTQLELEAAAELCRVSGWWALPYPVAERLARRPGRDDGVIVLGNDQGRATVSGIPARFVGVRLGGGAAELRAEGAASISRLGMFVSTVELIGTVQAVTDDVPALVLILQSWTLLGMIERALELTTVHAKTRRQFGRPLIEFQSVQFQLADGVVATSGLLESAKYAIWAFATMPETALIESLALRAMALEAAHGVFRIAHQLHGAIGFCDEHPLAWLTRVSQPIRRLPLSVSATEEALLALMESKGFPGLFTPAAAAYPPLRSADRPGAAW